MLLSIMYNILMWTGIILSIIGLVVFFGNLGGKTDKRFKTRQKDNNVGDSAAVGKGCLIFIVGANIIYCY